MATGDVTITKIYVGAADATALKTAVDGQNEGTQADGTKTAELIFIPLTAGQVVVWKKARSP